MIRFKILVLFSVLFLVSCASLPNQNQSVKPQELIIHVDSNQPIEHLNVEKPADDVVRSMEVDNPEARLSELSFIANGKAFIKIFSGLSVSDVIRFWNDRIYLRENTDIRDVDIFINSPGGDAFSGMALANEIERAEIDGFHIRAFASGIIASAAVPVFAVCSERIAASGTIFMVHEAALWKWPGRETASDIRSQNDLMGLLEKKYIEKLVNHSNLSKEKWEEMEKKTEWFSADKALEWGLVDKIE